MSKSNDNLVVTIDRFENGLAVVDFGHNQIINIAKRFLPKNVKAGDAMQVELLTDEQATKRRKNLAKAILEEILKGE